MKKSKMSNYFDCTNCGLCCGPVPVTELELKKIKKTVKEMPFATIYKLKAQKRGPLECMFRDIEDDKCTIYNARPDICKMFGFYEGMVCPNNPEYATRSMKDGHKRINKNVKDNPVVGVLSINHTWDNILK